VPKGQGGGAGGAFRNAAITLRDFGPAELLRHPLWSARYPRERLISALPWLLANPGAPPIDAVTGALGLPAGTSWKPAVEAFLRLWHRYA
jgi:hypothetical protein